MLPFLLLREQKYASTTTKRAKVRPTKPVKLVKKAKMAKVKKAKNVYWVPKKNKVNKVTKQAKKIKQYQNKKNKQVTQTKKVKNSKSSQDAENSSENNNKNDIGVRTLILIAILAAMTPLVMIGIVVAYFCSRNNKNGNIASLQSSIFNKSDGFLEESDVVKDGSVHKSNI
jgi:ATP-dependent Zn protease